MQPLISHRGGTIFHVNIKKTPVNPSKFCSLKIEQAGGSSLAKKWPAKENLV
jgi:hypothetical protein